MNNLTQSGRDEKEVRWLLRVIRRLAKNTNIPFDYIQWRFKRYKKDIKKG